MSYWTLLVIAGLFEVVGVIGIKRTAEKNNLLNNIMLYGGFIVSFQLLIQVMERIPLATAYAVWTGIGTVGAAIVGMLFFRESRNPFRLLCILGIIGAVRSRVKQMPRTARKYVVTAYHHIMVQGIAREHILIQVYHCGWLLNYWQ